MNVTENSFWLLTVLQHKSNCQNIFTYFYKIFLKFLNILCHLPVPNIIAKIKLLTDSGEKEQIIPN